MKIFIRNFLIGIKNIWTYLPLIWRTREWDYAYTLEILEFKLVKLGEYIEKHKRFVGWEYTVRDIRLCVKLLDKFREDYYGTEYIDYYEYKINFEPHNDKDSFVMFESHTFNEYFKKYPRIYKQVLKNGGIFKGTDDKTIAMNIAHINEQRCKKLVFKLLEEKIERWWD